MEVKKITNKQEWEDFVAQCTEKTFLQSWAWGDFHESLGNKVWRFGLHENDELISIALVVKISAKRGSFLLVPHGPVIKSDIHDTKLGVLKLLQETLKVLAEQEKADFIRISPIMKRSQEDVGLFKNLGFRQAPLHYHPESSWKLNIESDLEKIMDGMRKTTRYLIKKALQDKDIEIIKSTDINDMEIFYKLHTPVAKIQKFVPFSLEYLKKEFSAFLQDNNIVVYFAKYKGQYIATAFEIFWSGIGFYHHAALLPEFHKIPVSVLLQWEAIKEAKSRGCKVYDFWGYADPAKDPKHPYAGPTLFKMGFGGYVDEYVKTQDFVISYKYWINYIIEVARKLKRGL
ncbi:MAG: peptidoglycan bridge formation glycyltransferase FemA/FemB family protein [Candidatus Staskawiczbacteria bacterium]|nr:peptidoglycan bridge formation glycyltransferase FemA/FemB family protein [Candidatus Staskawiczbacteria bacterium]